MNAAFLELAGHPIKFRLFLIQKLPAAFFSGLKITEVNEQLCAVSVPYKWATKNPFRSTYFACLAMAAEMSTGVLAMGNIYKRKEKVSMLVTGMQAYFSKKATGITTFTCLDGDRISNAVKETIVSGESVEVIATSIGKNKAGEEIAKFEITWSFKRK